MENILKPKGMLCNVRKTIKQIIVCNRVKDNCNLLYIFSSFVLSCFCFCLQLHRKNNHDFLGVMQFLYYKSSSKHILKSEDRDRARVKELSKG